MARLILTGAQIMVACGLLTAVGCERGASQAAPPPPAVTVAQPVAREVQDYDAYTGRFSAVETVDVRARVKGYLVSIGFKDGDEVKKGQVLFQIDPRPFDAAVAAAEGQLGVVQAKRVKSQADVKRYTDLVPKGAASQQDLDKATGELAEAEAGIRAAEAQLEQAKLDRIYADITAPIDGVASRAMLTVGNLVGATGEQVLTTIVRIEPIQVYFDVDQRAVQQYQKRAMEQRAGGAEPKTVRDMNLTFHFGLASEDGFPHEGVLDFIDNKIDPATGTIMVRGNVENPKRSFRPGYFARVRVPMSDKYEAVMVSDRAIGTQQGQKYVLVVDEKNTVVFRPVKLGALQEDGLRVVSSGLNPQERIVVNGTQRARPGVVVAPQQGEMLAQPAQPAPPAQPAGASLPPTTAPATQPVARSQE